MTNSTSDESRMQVCASKDCDQLIPIGGTSGSYCSKCKAAREDLRQKEILEAGKADVKARKCATEGCEARAPIGGGSNYCEDCYRANRRDRRGQQKLTKYVSLSTELS